ncbi:MAG: hypothetical protein QOI20_3270 [Acidimicrobiaceae bacterium]|jgi:hypothetical protein|nr:hypothetical protein [Acidimicrobiaceae bacterium]
MGAYADLNEYVNRKTGGNSGLPDYFMVSKEWRIAGAVATAPAIGRWHSSWLLEGTPSHGNVPTTAAACDNTTSGGFMQTAPGGGRQKWLDSVVACCSNNSSVMIYDRLLHCGGLSGLLTIAQTVGGAITRYTGGVGNAIFVEINTAIGTTATTATVSYTNQAGTAGRTSPAFPIGGTNLREQGRAIPVPLQSGDSGVRSVESITLAGSTLTAGDFGVIIARPLMMLGLQSGAVGTTRTSLDGPIPDVSTACLAFMFHSNATTVPTTLSLFAAMAER